ncbi:hypothetical protein [Streptomyces jeddahensis]|uniref:Uncharacterized protein n=1 Tax=Streptomyces jeddahensis TaxID=1716141 RepID=A0A177HS07_9ACTN|nr:hypothetical protein [Streptomyces jeddahensis]OAH12974.1 hypothetical protein STSP_36200 [Streptomyces jeddahensis]
MTTPSDAVPLPLSLPLGEVPAAPDWFSKDAARWCAAAPPRWTGLGLQALALVVALVGGLLVIGFSEPDQVCSERDPCGTDWQLLPFAAVLVFLPCAVLWLPSVARVLLPFGLVVPVAGLAGASRLSAGFLAGGAVMALGLAVAWCAVHVRLRARGRQRALHEEATAGYRAALPRPLPRFRGGLVRITTGAVLLLVGGLFVLWGVVAQSESDARGARAEAVPAVVLGYAEGGDGDPDVRVEFLEGPYPGETRTIGSGYAHGYPVARTVTVLVDGTWLRLRAEPYDAMPQQLAAALFLAPGAALIGRGLLLNRRARALRSGPQPVLRVAVWPSTGEQVVDLYPVNAADAGDVRARALRRHDQTVVIREAEPEDDLAAWDVGVDELDDEENDELDDEDAYEDEDEYFAGVLYGPFHEDAAPALLTGLPRGGVVLAVLGDVVAG